MERLVNSERFDLFGRTGHINDNETFKHAYLQRENDLMAPDATEINYTIFITCMMILEYV